MTNACRLDTAGDLWRSPASLHVHSMGLVGSIKGLLCSPEPLFAEAFWLHGWPALIHMLGMRYPIDAVWLDRGRTVLHIETLRPWRFAAWGGWRAVSVLELRAGEAARLGLRVGDTLVPPAPDPHEALGAPGDSA